MPGSKTDGRSSLAGNLKTVKVRRLRELITEETWLEFVCVVMCMTPLKGE